MKNAEIAEGIAALKHKNDEFEAAFIEAEKSLQKLIALNVAVDAENAALLRGIRQRRKQINQANYEEKEAELQQRGYKVA